jgi:hypothetical protein
VLVRSWAMTHSNTLLCILPTTSRVGSSECAIVWTVEYDGARTSEGARRPRKPAHRETCEQAATGDERGDLHQARVAVRRLLRPAEARHVSKSGECARVFVYVFACVPRE